MSRAGLIALTLVVSACSSSLDVPPSRLVLLQYSSVPTAADSLAASQIGGGPVTIYPIITTMTVRTRVATSAFAALNPQPRITDGDNISPGCGEPSVFFTTHYLVTANDSAAAALAGILVLMYSRNRTEFAGTFDRTMLNSLLSQIGGLAADTNIATVDLDMSGPCPGLDLRSR
jgi:hypothetical protein